MSSKFWKIEWIIVGLIILTLNLYFFLTSNIIETSIFTFIAICISIILLIIKLYDNENQRELAYKIAKLEIKKNNLKSEKLISTFKSKLSEILESKDNDFKNSLIYEVFKSIDLKDNIFSDSKIKLIFHEKLRKNEIENPIETEFYNLIFMNYINYLSKNKGVFSKENINEYLKSKEYNKV